MTPARLPAAHFAQGLAGLEILGQCKAVYGEILTRDALAFLIEIERRFRDERHLLLLVRNETRERLAAGGRLDFPVETRPVRESDWAIDPVPDDLVERRVELIGPAERASLRRGLAAGADVLVADLEDGLVPTWPRVVEAQIHLRDAIAAGGAGVSPVLMVRVRGWHLEERHVRLDGIPVSASVFDFALFFWHNVHTLLSRGSGPYFHLPKLESHLEARLWNQIFAFAQDALDIPRGTIRATAAIETLTAAHEMDEILYQLREHSAGLCFGYGGYTASTGARLGRDPALVLPDRGVLTTGQHALRCCRDLTVQTCHRRGAHAIAGLAAGVVADDVAAVRLRARSEAAAGMDGAWIMEPALVATVREQFEALVATPNQIERQLEDVRVSAPDLRAAVHGRRTWEGLQQHVRLVIGYLAAWLGGNGRPRLGPLLASGATAEAARVLVWQWLHHGVVLAGGERVDRPLVIASVDRVLAEIRAGVGEKRFRRGRFRLAADLLLASVTAPEVEDFLLPRAYPWIFRGTVSRG